MPNQNNYITGMIQRYGDNWIVAATPESIQKAGKRIIKEMVNGLMNYEQVGSYYTDPKFLENLIIVAKNELDSNRLVCDSLVFYRNNFLYIDEGDGTAYLDQNSKEYQDYISRLMIKRQDIQFINPTITHYEALTRIYSTVLDRLSKVKDTNNVGYLADISAVLYSIRSHLN